MAQEYKRQNLTTGDISDSEFMTPQQAGRLNSQLRVSAAPYRWMSVDGLNAGIEKPYPMCSGAPTVADCAKRGYCAREHACND